MLEPHVSEGQKPPETSEVNFVENIQLEDTLNLPTSTLYYYS
jgi:hypothetical protein